MRILIISALVFNLGFSAVVDDYLSSLKQEVLQENPKFTGFDAKRGEEIFTSKHIGKKGKEISCTTCHTINLNNSGENTFTGKTIEPLSPKANPKRFTDVKEIEKWMKRNFNDVYNREGTALEKGDVTTYIINK
jgi:cytochrome c peroxidase